MKKVVDDLSREILIVLPDDMNFLLLFIMLLLFCTLVSFGYSPV